MLTPRILIALALGPVMGACASKPAPPIDKASLAQASRASDDREAPADPADPDIVPIRNPGGDTVVSSTGRTLPGGGTGCTEGALPDFPWPMPAPSARMALPSKVLEDATAYPGARLRDAADTLDELLLAAGYSERAYFRLRKEDQTVGFALVTRMERIRKDGTPYPQRDRFLPIGADERFDIVQFLKSLFIAPVGYYRVLVFTVSREPVRATGPSIAGDVADDWLASGGTRLLGCVAHMPLTDDYGVDALIYEFRHAPEERRASRSARRDTQVSQLIPSKLDPAIHLQRAGILSR